MSFSVWISVDYEIDYEKHGGGGYVCDLVKTPRLLEEKDQFSKLLQMPSIPTPGMTIFPKGNGGVGALHVMDEISYWEEYDCYIVTALVVETFDWDKCGWLPGSATQNMEDASLEKAIGTPQKWTITRLFFSNGCADRFVICDEQGKQVCADNSARKAVEEALRIAASQKIGVEIVGSPGMRRA